MKKSTKILALVLSLVMVLALMPMGVLADGSTSTPPAEVAPAKVGTATELTTAVTAGGSIQLTADIPVNEQLTVANDTTIDTNGHKLTVKPTAGMSGIIVNETATLTLTDTVGSGSLTIDGSNTPNGYKDGDRLVINRGINCFGNLTITGGTVNIKNTLGYGIAGDSVCKNFKMTGGTLNIISCGKSSAKNGEGGFIWSNSDDSTTCQFLGGEVNMNDCGNTLYGCMYVGCPLTFGDGTTPLTVNLENSLDSTAVKNAIVLVGGKNLTVNKNATVNVVIAGKYENCRGINIGGTGTTVTVDGKLNISKDAGCDAATVYGIKGVAGTQLKVNDGGLVNISGYSPAENVLPNVYVTMNGGSMDLGGTFTAAPAASTLQLDDDDAALNETLSIAADTTIDTNGKTLTVAPESGHAIDYKNSNVTVNMNNSKLVLDGKNAAATPLARGIYFTSGCENCALNLKDTDLKIADFAGYGIYRENGKQSSFVMDGGSLNIENCGTTTEGGFLWDAGLVTFNSGAVNINGCGEELYGPLAITGNAVFGDGGNEPLVVNLSNSKNATNAQKNILVVTQGDSAKINSNATVNINMNYPSVGSEGHRGINITQPLIIDGGKLNITNTSTATGTVYGIKSTSTLTVTDRATVTVNGATIDSSALSNTITGGSVYMDAGIHVINGVQKINGTIVNGTVSTKIVYNPKAYNNDLIRFDIPGTGAERTLKIANPQPSGDPSTYDYKLAANSGTDYVWAPSVQVEFFSSKADAVAAINGSTKSQIAVLATICGNNLNLVGAAAPDAPTAPAGQTFTGWTDTDGNAFTMSTTVNKNLFVYPVYGTQPSGGGGNPTPAPEPTDVPDPDVPKAELPADLNSTDHIAYIIGKPDGNVDPNGQITRAEVATAFYRLLTAERRDAIFTSTSTFSDVSKTQWFNKAVASMANGKYIKGYTDGTFGGNRSITRAEFVAIAARFMDAKSGTVTFSDVSSTNWAYQYISTAVAYGWINGYPDGTFKPDQAISRAEAMKIINTMLARGVDAAGLISGIKAWPDNTNVNAWYYYEIIEATNNHLYEGSRPSEKWSSLQTNYVYDIVKYEHP